MLVRVCVISAVKQVWELMLAVFNIFLELTTTEALDGFEGLMKIGKRTMTNLRFADDIFTGVAQ